MDTLASLRITALDMLKSAAAEHKRLMAEEIVAFQVPHEMFDALKKEPGWRQSAISYLGYIDNFTFIARKAQKIHMFEKGSNFPFIIMEDEQ